MDPTPLPIELLAYFTPADLARGALKTQVDLSTWLVEIVLDVALLLALAFGGIGRRVWSACSGLQSRVRSPLLERALGPAWLAGAAFGAAVGILREIACLPIVVGRDWFFVRALGLSHETWSRFAGLVALDAVRSAFGLALLGLVLGAVRSRWPRRWWLTIGAVASVGLVGSAIVEPLWFRAAFEVRPLAAGPLRDRLETLLIARGEPVAEIVTLDVSKHGSAVNAMVTGFGPTRWIVLTDTLVALGDDAVAGAVMHEIGHRRGERLPWRLAWSAVGLVGFLWLVERLLRLGLARGAASDMPALAFVVAVCVVAGTLVTPIRAAFGRAEEREADRVELEARRDHDAYIAENVRLARANALDPAPAAWARLLGSHPSPAERIGLALWYRTRVEQAKSSIGTGP